MQQLTEEQRKQLEEKLKGMTPEQLKELQKQQCIFCQIVAGKIPSKKVYEDKRCAAVLDINPAAKGHILLLPREHYAIMPQVPEEILGHLFLVAKNLSQVLLKTFKADGTNIFIANGSAAGQRAQHFLVHVIPRKGGDGILNMEEKLVNQEMVSKIKSAVEGKLQESLGLKKLEGKKEERKEEAKEEREEPEKEMQEKVKPERKKPAQKKWRKPKQTIPKKGENNIKSKPEKEKASLDDIARLFT